MHQVGIFLFNEVELLDFAGPYEVFSVTSELNGYQLFNVFTISADGEKVKTVNGLTVVPDYSFSTHPPVDILIIPGGVGTKLEIAKAATLAWVQRNSQTSVITMSVCSGARILAALGLLDHREATTHHEVMEHVKALAPTAILTAEKRFVDNESVMTSGGISAGIDLSLHIVEKLYGTATAHKTIRYLEYGDWKSTKGSLVSEGIFTPSEG